MSSYTFFLLFTIIGGIAIIGTGVVNGNIKTGFPVVRDSDLEIEVVADGLYLPTNMRFVDNDTIIVTEQNGVIKIVDLLPSGKAYQKPILKLNSSKVAVENGLVGLAVMNNMAKSSTGNENEFKDLTNGTGYRKSANLSDVFLYFTEGDGDKARNRLHKYSFDGQNFRNDSLLLDLPTNNLSIHNGGKIVIGPDGYLYTVIGDQYHRGKLQNVMNGSSADNTGVIFKIDPAGGLAAPRNPFASNSSEQLSKYYAYGIRNSYGLALDPVTGNLWDTENGDGLFDEINLVMPGFNSGWVKIMGPSTRPLNENVSVDDDLVHFPGSNYSDPAFSWQQTIGVTDLEFLNSTKLGPEYNNTLFVGDFNTGSLFNFKLNSNRTGFTFNSTSLKDLVADNTKPDANSEITFGAGFSIITDIQTGPDGLLYILGYGSGSHTGVSGVIYRIQPTEKYDLN